jgi:hypothetical protein
MPGHRHSAPRRCGLAGPNPRHRGLPLFAAKPFIHFKRQLNERLRNFFTHVSRTLHSPAMTTDAGLARVARAITPEAELVAAWPLEGGTSARITALDIGLPGGRRDRVVVREYGAADLRANPHAAHDEYRLLEVVRAAGVPAPRPCLADESGEILPGPTRCGTRAG